MMEDYAELQGHLNRVRGAWKRAAALQGLATVMIEGIGLFTLFALLDTLYLMPPVLRIAALSLLLIALLGLTIRHVLRPLMREISDAQIALYVEERQQDSSGTLSSATAFGSKASSETNNALYQYIVENTLLAALKKAKNIKPSGLLDLSRLRKYAFVAILVLFVFGITAVRFSDFVRIRTERLLLPWQLSEEELPVSETVAENELPLDFQISTSPSNRLVLRGSVVKIKTQLSRLCGKDVFLHFRFKDSGEFQILKMNEIEEQNTYALRLPDITDDVEFRVQTGSFVSENIPLKVYDLLEIKGYEIRFTPPDYAARPVMTANLPNGDIAALVGTRVKLRTRSNTPLEKGTLKFDDHSAIAMTPVDGDERSLEAEFTVEKDSLYTVEVQSIDNQNSGPSHSFTVRAQKDEPPSITIMSPNANHAVPLQTDVPVTVKVNDDIGLSSVVLTYNQSHAQSFREGEKTSSSHQMPFSMPENGAGEQELSLVFKLADAKVGDTLLYSVTATDLKGQSATSDTQKITILPSESTASPESIRLPSKPLSPDPQVSRLNTKLPDLHQPLKADVAQALLAAADKLKKRQEQILAEMKTLSAQENPQGDHKKLEEKQRDLVQETQVLAPKISGQISSTNIKSQTLIEDIRSTAKIMEAVARQIQNNNLQQAAARSEQAIRDLHHVSENLRMVQNETLETAVEALVDRALALQRAQKQIHAQTEKIISEARQRQPKADVLEFKSDEILKMQDLSRFQVEARKSIDNVETYLSELAHRSEKTPDKKETAVALKKAVLIMKQSGMSAIMEISAFALIQQDVNEIRKAQSKIEQALDDFVQHLQSASGELAQIPEQKMKRVLNISTEIQQTLTQLLPEINKTQPPQAALMTQIQIMQSNTQRLVRHLEHDKLSDSATLNTLQTFADPSAIPFEDMFHVAQKKRLDTFTQALQSVSVQVTEKLESALKTKQLSATQREQTPVLYRDKVSKYYELLAKGSKK